MENFLGWHIGWYEESRYSHWYSAWHFVALVVVAGFFVSMCLLFRGKSKNEKTKFLKVIAIVMIALEVLRMAWRTYSYFSYIKHQGSVGFNAGEIISFALCAQLVWFTTISLLINSERWNKHAYNVMFPTNIIAGVLALFVPTSIFNAYYPFYHFSTLQTLTQHALILFVPVFLLATGLLAPRFKDCWKCLAFTAGFWVIAHFSNMIWHRNFMWTTYFDMVPGFENFKFPFTVVPLMIMFIPYSLFCFGAAHFIQLFIARHKAKSCEPPPAGEGINSEN